MTFMREVVRSIDREGDAQQPFLTEDPVWSDTWGVCAVDPDSNQAYWAQVLCNASTGRARHLLFVIGGGTSFCKYDYTDTAFDSDMMHVEIDGWRRYLMIAPGEDILIEAVSAHDPVDFGKLLSFASFSLGHQEVGVRATGHIRGRAFDGVGLRDRSFGPRPMGGVGALTTVVMNAMDQSASFAANIVWGSDRPLAGPASTRFAFINTPDGTQALHGDAIGIRRHSDGIVSSLRVGEHVITLDREIGHHHYTPHWYPAIDVTPGEHRIFTHILRFFEGNHPRFGRMAGFVDMAFLAGC